MTELKQRRWFSRKTLSLQPDHEILMTERGLLRSKVKKYPLFDLHPFYERYQNNALGYLLAACFLFILGLSQGLLTLTMTALSFSALAQAWVILGCSAVMFVMFAIHRIAKYEFFHRGTGKPVFCVWQSQKPKQAVVEFTNKLSGAIRTAHEDRFKDARERVNPKLRHSASEEAINTLYRIGALDFTELETLLANAYRKYHSKPTSSALRENKRGNNIIDMDQYRRKKASETHA